MARKKAVVTALYSNCWTGIYLNDDCTQRFGPAELHIKQSLAMLEKAVTLMGVKFVYATAPYTKDQPNLPDKLSDVKGLTPR